MLSCRNVVKPLPKSTTGNPWLIKKTGSGIPYITDGSQKKWCMAIFQEQAAAAAAAASSSAALPSLEVAGDELDMDATADASNPALRAALPGVSPAAGISKKLSLAFFNIDGMFKSRLLTLLFVWFGLT